MSRYETYKKGGLDWEPEVPKHWSLRRLSTLGRFKTGGTPPNKEGVESKGEIPWITPQDMWRFDIDRTKNFITSEAVKKLNYKLFPKGSILLVCIASIGKISICKKDSYSNQQITAITDMECNNRFLMYSLKGQMEKIKNDASSNVVPIINTKYLKTIMIPFPPEKEQEQIADYLDWKINEIDKLISIEKDKLNKIRLLKEQHIEDIIFNNGSENSISNWYNYLPKMATEIKIKNIFRLRDERNYLPEEEVELLSLYTRLGVIKNKDIDKRTGNKNTTVHNYKKVYQQDIVVNIMLCWMGAIGISDYNGVTSPAYDVYKPDLKRVNPKYYHYLFRTNKFKSELYKNGKGIVLMKWRVYADRFKNIIVPLPSLDEQRRIVGLIEKAEFNIREYIRLINNTIIDLGLLKESLISEVVTGQIDVRNVVIPTYEKVDSIVDEEVEGEELLEYGD